MLMEEYPGDHVRGPFLPHLNHYFGDIVRQIFISTAALILVAAPFYADNLRVELPFEIGGALALVALAALANPHNRGSMVGSSIAAGVGLVIYEIWALYAYHDSSWVQFFLRELIALLFLVAFYFSLKTVRAFIMHQVGKRDVVDEFEGERRGDEGAANSGRVNNL